MAEAPPGRLGLPRQRRIKQARDFAHHTLKFRRHVVQRPVCEHDRKLFQSFGVNSSASQDSPGDRPFFFINTLTEHHPLGTRLAIQPQSDHNKRPNNEMNW